MTKLPATPRARPIRLELSPEWSGAATPFRHTWAGFVNVDQFRWLVRGDMQAQLTLARTELGGRHVRAVGMFDDELRVLRPGPESYGVKEPAPRLNWQIVDAAIDALLERGLRPVFTTTFIPSVLASGTTTVFTTKGVTSPPRDYAEWGRFVASAVRHQIDRHGIDEVRGWYFEVWNEPNLKGWFWDGDQADFFRLWDVTYRAIKRVDRRLRVGGPSTGHAEWLEAFLAYGSAHRCVADFLALHIYNNDGADVALAPFSGPQAERVSRSPDQAADVIRERSARARTLGFTGEIHWNEWGRSWRPQEPDRETVNEAAFVVRTMAQVSQEADAFAYWCLSDIYDQVGYGRQTFHGNYGLLSLQGLRKPAYHAFQLLNRLGDLRIPLCSSGSDTFVNAVATRRGRRWQVLVYAYVHESGRRRTGEVRVTLPKVRGRLETVLTRLGAEENNILATWKSIGAPDYLTPAERAQLVRSNLLRPARRGVRIEHVGTDRVAVFQCEFPGVALLEIEPLSS